MGASTTLISIFAEMYSLYGIFDMHNAVIKDKESKNKNLSCPLDHVMAYHCLADFLSPSIYTNILMFTP